jgi:hypothetical protein
VGKDLEEDRHLFFKVLWFHLQNLRKTTKTSIRIVEIQTGYLQ